MLLLSPAGLHVKCTEGNIVCVAEPEPPSTLPPLPFHWPHWRGFHLNFSSGFKLCILIFVCFMSDVAIRSQLQILLSPESKNHPLVFYSTSYSWALASWNDPSNKTGALPSTSLIKEFFFLHFQFFSFLYIFIFIFLFFSKRNQHLPDWPLLISSCTDRCRISKASEEPDNFDILLVSPPCSSTLNKPVA